MSSAAIVAPLVVTSSAAWWLGRQSTEPEAPWSVFTQLTDASGVETSPSLRLDGSNRTRLTSIPGEEVNFTMFAPPLSKSQYRNLQSAEAG